MQRRARKALIFFGSIMKTDRVNLPEVVYVAKAARDEPFTRELLEKIPGIPVEMVANEEVLVDRFALKEDPAGAGKRSWFLTLQRGDFVKPCPCTPHYLGCRYYVINLDVNCPMDCSYCILQHYLSHPLITIHVNTDKLWRQLDEFLAANPRPLRIGTGELGDSLALDPLTERSGPLIEYFRRHSEAVLELKTKTVNIGNVLNVEPAENIVIAWSLNAPRIAALEELGAPPVAARLAAAGKVVEHGYRVAFHFDPIVRHPGWEKGYEGVIDDLLKKIPVERIAWISLGSLRFPAALKPVVEERFPESTIVFDEFIRGRDGKFRYFYPIRRELYTRLVDRIRDGGGERIPLYFCMEGKRLWRNVLKKEPKGEEEVETYLSSPSGS